MDSIVHFGPVVLTIKWIVILLSLTSAYLITSMRSRAKPHDISLSLIQSIPNVIICGFLVWKLSLIIVSPSKVWHEPMSLLYFDGGLWGFAISLASIVGYFVYRVRKRSYLARQLWTTLAIFTVVTAITYTGASALVNTFHFSTLVGSPIGKPANDFELTSSTGELHKLSAYRGKVVVLNFWATWCLPCRVEIPEMVEYTKDRLSNKHDNAIIIAINATYSEQNVTSVNQFAIKQQMNFPILLDTHAKISNLYRITAFPTTLIIDPHGIIRYLHIGPMNKSMLDNWVERSLLE